MVGTRALAMIAAVCAWFACTAARTGETRTWTNQTGEFTIDAELVVIQQSHVVLRHADGRQITVPLTKLSGKDQEFVAGLTSPDTKLAAALPPAAAANVAKQFYTLLRDEKREAVGEAITAKAQEVLKAGKSPVTNLPAPEPGERAVRVGRAKVDGNLAEVTVQVRLDHKMHKTKIYLRQEDDQWRVFALSVMYPDGDKSINFEMEEAAAGDAGADPLQALVGQPFQFAGVTLNGQPLNLAQYQGKVVLVDFWATWCPSCRAEMPNVLANYQKYRPQGFDVIAVSVDQDLEALSSLISKNVLPWPVVVDNFPGNPQPMATRYGIRDLPAHILIGKDGKVAAVNCRGKQLGEELDKLLGAETGKEGS